VEAAVSAQETVMVDLLRKILKELEKISADTDTLAGAQVQAFLKDNPNAMVERYRPHR
jgi:hypothetical protein